MSRKPSVFNFDIGEHGVNITLTHDFLIEGAKTPQELEKLAEAAKADLDETVERAKAALQKHT